MLKFSFDSAGTNLVKDAEHFVGDGTTTKFYFTRLAGSDIVEVRIFDSTHPNGDLQESGTDYTIGSDGGGDYIEFATAPADGSVIECSTSGNRIFYDKAVVANSAEESERTMEAMYYLIETGEYEYNSVNIHIMDQVWNAGLDMDDYWIAPDSSGSPGTYVRMAQEFTGDGTTTDFTLTEFSGTQLWQVYVDGVLQEEGTDYTVSGDTITFTSAPADGAKIMATYRYDVGNMPQGGTHAFWLKCIVPQQTTVSNLRDPYLQAYGVAIPTD